MKIALLTGSRLVNLPQVDILPSVWVEGIGNIVRGPLFSSGNLPNNGMWNELLCVSLEGNLIYKSTIDWYADDNIDLTQNFQNCGSLIENTANTEAEDYLQISPNPVNSASWLKIRSGHPWNSISIINGNGKKTQQQNLTGGEPYQHYLGDLAPGLYIIRLSENQRTDSRKIVVR